MLWQDVDLQPAHIAGLTGRHEVRAFFAVFGAHALDPVVTVGGNGVYYLHR